MDPNTVAETVAATPYGYAIAMIGVAMCVFLCGIGSCIGLFKSSAAAAGVLSENPKLFGKVLVLVLLPATQGIYGFIIGIIASGALGDTAMGTVEGWALLGAVLPMAIAGLVSGIYQGKASANCIYAVGKQEPLSGKLIIYPAMIECIRSARHNINMQTFIFADDRIGRIMMGELKKKAQEGVQVRVICDRFGSFKSLFSLFFLPYLKKTPNLKMIPFSNASLLTPWRIQLRNHRKLLIVDGRTAFIGGLNISEENFKWMTSPEKEIHDFHCRLTGPSVGELQYAFLCDWFYASHKKNKEDLFTRDYFPMPEKCGDSIVRAVASGHGYLFEGSEKAFFTAASTAKKSIWIISPYFAPSKDFSKALRMASARGVDVRLIVPRNNNHWYVKMAARSFYESLIGNGVRVFERLGTFTHAKAMLVDGEWAYFGSSNCDIRSFRLNYELDLLVSQGDFTGALHRQFLEELKNSEEMGEAYLASRTRPQKLLESVCALMTPVL